MSLFAKLHAENRLPGFGGATGWLNSEPLTADGLRGKVVLVDFWTYTCINWLRTLGYVRAWHEKYEEQGLVVVGVHTPEFPFERDTDNVRWAAAYQRVEYPIALDPEFAVWRAFSNNYWPAVYIADAEGTIRHMHFGEGGYEECEMVVQMLLARGRPRRSRRRPGLGRRRRVRGAGRLGHARVPRDLSRLRAGAELRVRRRCRIRGASGVRRTGASGAEPVGAVGKLDARPGKSVANQADGRLAFRFHARDVNLVMSPPASGAVAYRVLVDGEPPGAAHGLDVDEEGSGTLDRPRLHQLIRQPRSISDRTFEITFLAPGAELYCITFG